VAAIPEKLALRTDDYFSQSCELVPDGSGLPQSPATALSGYWKYDNSCVAMTGAVYVVRLKDGRHVKLKVEDYYEPSVQEQCDTTGMIPMSGTGSANFRVRWAFLP
jgi:hypothetical protein